MKTIGYYLASFCMLIMLVTSCQQEEDFISENQHKGTFSIQCIPSRMGVIGAGTRAVGDPGDQLTDDERKINELHVFLFDNAGNYLQNKSGSAEDFQGYTYIEGNRSLVINNEVLDVTAASDATIYVLANLETGTVLSPRDGDGIPYLRNPDPEGPDIKVTNCSVLDNYVYRPVELSLSLPKNGLPMRARMDNQNISTGHQGESLIQVMLESLMARVDLTFKMHIDHPENVEAMFPQYWTHSLEVVNIPESTQLNPAKDGSKTSAKTTTLKDNNWEQGPIRHEYGSISRYFYMFEHYRYPDGNPEYPTSFPDGEDENIYKQRYKPNIAENATNGQGDAVCVKIGGTYYNHNHYALDISYSLYLGANAVNDFVVKRDRQYRNSITIKGITATDNPNNPGDVELDTRVNLEETDPYYISILREREHDAHFNVTPMDVYVLSKPGYVTVEIENPEENDWIRMEYVGHQEQEGGGKQKYFYTDLLTKTLNNPENKKVTIHDENVNGERIYLYLDENLDWDYQKHQGVDRQVNLIISYYEDETDQTPATRNLVIMQKGLKLLEIKKNDGGMSYDGYRGVETYEEFDNYFDPKSDFNATYSGLPWGAYGTNTYSVFNYWEGVPYLSKRYDDTYFLTQGKHATERLMNMVFADDKDHNLNEKPNSAAEYCYNKNKRNSNGEVVSVDWYLPAITEMEFVVTNYHLDNPTFQTDFYWSSCERWNTRDNSIRARATKVMRSTEAGNINGWRWENSDPGDEGDIERTKECRIRCVRILPDGYAPTN